MKKILLFASLVSAFAFVNAQTYVFTWNERPLENGDTITLIYEEDQCDLFYSIYVNSTETESTTISTERLVDSDIEVFSICAGINCYNNIRHLANYTPNAFNLDPNVDNEIHVVFNTPAGSTNTLFRFKTYNTDNTSDGIEFYVKVIDNLEAINIAENAPKFTLFPNPTSSMLNITMDENKQMATVSIYNMAGQQVLESVIPAGITSMTLNVADLPKGVYNVTVGNGNAKKLVVK